MTQQTVSEFLDSLRPSSEEERRARIDQLIESISTSTDHFEMSSYLDITDEVPYDEHADTTWDERWNLPLESFSNACGTTLCLAGWATVHALPKYYPDPGTQLVSLIPPLEVDENTESYRYFDIGCAWLGLMEYEANRLFYATHMDRDQAVDVLRTLRETSIVDIPPITTQQECADD